MLKACLRYALRIAEALGIGLLILAAFLAWQVSRGPVALDFLAPYVNDMLNAPDRLLTTRVGGVEVAWGGWDERVDVRATDVSIRNADRSLMALAPQAAFSLSGEALLSGRLAVHGVELRSPEVVVYRDTGGRFPALTRPADGAAVSSDDDGDAGPAARLRVAAERLLADDGTGAARYLERVRVVDGAFTVHDQHLETTWALPRVSLTLVRGPDAVRLESTMRARLRGTPARFGADLRYTPGDGIVAGEVVFRGVDPPLLADLVPEVVPAAARAAPVLRRIGTPVSGAVQGAVRLRGGFRVTRGRLDLSLGAGSLRLPAPVGRAYTITGGHVTGRYEPERQRLVLERIRLDPGGAGAPSVTGAATVSRPDAGFAVDARATVRNMPVDRLPGYWPESLAANPRAWIRDNLSGGMLPATTFEVGARVGPDGVSVDRFRGEGRVEGTRVTYFDPMPAVKAGTGKLTLRRDRVTIDVDGGELYGQRVTDGRVRFTDFHAARPWATIDLTVQGPLKGALRIIDSPPLGYAGNLGLDPEAVGGRGETRLHLRLPLLDDLKLEQVEFNAQADLEAVRLPGAVMGRTLTDGILALKVNRERLAVAGRAKVAGVPVKLTWKRDFSDAGMGHYTLRATLNNAQRRALGLGGVPFRPPLVTGPVGARLKVERGPDKSVVHARLDLAEARLTLPRFGWKKPRGEPGEARIDLRLVDGAPRKVPEFTVAAGDLVLQGGAAFGPEGGVRRVDFQRFAFGRTDLTAVFFFPEDGSLDVDVEGREFDATNLLDPAFSEADRAKAGGEGDGAAEDVAPPFTLSVNVDRVWVSGDGAIGNVAGAVTRRQGRWQKAEAQAVLPGGAPLEIALKPREGGRHFRLEAGDAGRALAVLDLYDNMAGGDLTIEGTIQDDKPGRPMAGTIRVRDFRITNAPLLAQLLSVASLTGILDVLKGDGLPFKALELPFRREDTAFRIEEGRAWGPSIGLTGSGRVNLTDGTVNLHGTIVPAYTINSLLGHVPLVGDLLTGGKGGGVFAATYTIKGTPEKATIDVNPLAALAPGVLRNLFGGPPEELRKQERGEKDAADGG